MLNTDQKMEIKRLSEQGLNVTRIANQLGMDWKTVKRVLGQNGNNGRQKPDQAIQCGNSQADNELTKVIFQKLNSGMPPREIIAQIGHIDLVTNLYERWKKLIWYISENSKPPDPQIAKTPGAWMASFEKYPDWHQKKAIRAVGIFAMAALIRCPYFNDKDHGCSQIGQVTDPFGCFECTWFYNRLFK